MPRESLGISLNLCSSSLSCRRAVLTGCSASNQASQRRANTGDMLLNCDNEIRALLYETPAGRPSHRLLRGCKSLWGIFVNPLDSASELRATKTDYFLHACMAFTLKLSDLGPASRCQSTSSGPYPDIPLVPGRVVGSSVQDSIASSLSSRLFLRVAT
jgi:hypothetical protein